MAADDPKRELPLIGRDIPFSAIEDELCRVVNFGNLSKVVDGKVVSMMKNMPYGYLEVESKNLPETAMLTLNHKDDYLHVWEFAGKQELPDSAELLVIWTNSHYKKGAGLFKSVLPKLWVTLFHKGYYDFSRHNKRLTDYERDYDQSISYQEFVSPIKDIKPEVME